MTTLTAIIADDEDNLRDYLRNLLADKWPDLEIIAEASNGDEAISIINKYKPDIAFLDIKMPGVSGLNVAQNIHENYKNIKIVFITAYTDFAIKAFEFEAVDYLLKPIDKNKLQKTVERLQSQIQGGKLSNPDLSLLLQKFNDSLTPKKQYIRWIKALDKGKVYIIPIEDVRYIQAGDKYTTVVTHEKNWLIRKPVKELEAELDPDNFWRIHRGVIVNATSILSAERMIDGRYELQILDCSKPLIVSRAYGHCFKQM